MGLLFTEPVGRGHCLQKGRARMPTDELLCGQAGLRAA